MIRELGIAEVRAAVAGGSVLAAGGGGWVSHGELVGSTAVQYGGARLMSLDELGDHELVATVTAIGAPAAHGWEMRPRDYVRALELLMAESKHPIVGTITAQNGSSTTCNGWTQSAVLGTVVVDAAGDGRAHPTGKMGSLGLAADPAHRTLMAAAGGNRADRRYLEVVASGTVRSCANTLRTAADEAGGFIAAARNPLPVEEIRARAAVGAISFALRLGEAMLAAEQAGPEAVIEAVAETLGGRILARGVVRNRTLRTEHAFDIGALDVGELELAFVNEYLTADAGGERVATFPDLLTTLSLERGRPISIADVQDGDRVAVLHVEKARLPLGAGVLEPSVYPELEQMLGRELTRHALA